MKESKVEQLTMSWFDSVMPDIWYMKTQGNMYGKNGAPDYTGSYKGLMFGVETKAGNGHPLSMIQMHEGLKIVASGGLFVVAFGDFSGLENAIKSAQPLNFSKSIISAKSLLSVDKLEYEKLNDIRKSINKSRMTQSFMGTLD